MNIQNINIPIINTLDDNIFDEVVHIFNKNYDNLEIPSTEIIEWLNKGLILHDCKDECLFCGNKINIESIKKIVSEYNTNEKQKDSLKLMKFSDILNSIMENCNEILNNIDTYSLALGKNIVDITNNIGNSKEIFQKSISILNEKASNITTKKELDLEIVKNEVSESSKISKTILEIKNKKIDEINNKINKLSSLIKGGIYLDIIQNTLIQTNIVKINEIELLLKEYDIKNEKINDRINVLKMSKSNTQDFANHINKILEGIEVNLKLEPIEDDYIIRHTKENKILQIKDISEGEQNLLALLYFYYEIFEDENQTIMKNQIELIILDDPITSMDDINKTYIIELIKHLFEFQKCQVFVFTHIWDDFCNICYGKYPKNDKEFMFYEIKKDVNGSKIVIANTSETPYQHGFKEIFELAQKPNGSVLDDCEIYHYPNTMRKVLEEFLSFKIKKSNPTSNNSENIKKVLSQKSWHNNDDIKLSTLLNVCNTLSHKFARNPDEIIKSARFLMNKIEEVDGCHFNTMKQ